MAPPEHDYQVACSAWRTQSKGAPAAGNGGGRSPGPDRMFLIFLAFAAVAALFWAFAPYIAGGIGADMMLIYLSLAVIAALLALLRRT